MKKSHIILFIGGALVAIGMVTSFYGAKFATEDLAITEGVVSQTSPIELTKELDPAIAESGVLVVHAENVENSDLVATVFDPSGKQVISEKIDQISTERQFEINAKGTYKTLLENSASEIRIIAGMTHLPDKNIIALNIFAQSIIISGFIGLGAAAVYEIKNRRKKLS
jgi:hypothetical protein